MLNPVQWNRAGATATGAAARAQLREAGGSRRRSLEAARRTAGWAYRVAGGSTFPHSGTTAGCGEGTDPRANALPLPLPPDCSQAAVPACWWGLRGAARRWCGVRSSQRCTVPPRSQTRRCCCGCTPRCGESVGYRSVRGGKMRGGPVLKPLPPCSVKPPAPLYPNAHHPPSTPPSVPLPPPCRPCHPSPPSSHTPPLSPQALPPLPALKASGVLLSAHEEGGGQPCSSAAPPWHLPPTFSGGGGSGSGSGSTLEESLSAMRAADGGSVAEDWMCLLSEVWG